MTGNDHGWITVGEAEGGGVVTVAPALADERRRCACPRRVRAMPCIREATAEDLLCDECREHCTKERA